MTDFRVGDEVVCVNDGAPTGEPQVMSVDGYRWLGTKRPGGISKGTIYTVKAVGPSIAGTNALCVWLVETANYTAHGVDIGYRASRFRKIQRRDLSAWLNTAATDTDHLDRPVKTPARPKVDALLQRVQSGEFG